MVTVPTTAVAAVSAASVGVDCGYFYCSVHWNAWRWLRPAEVRPRQNVSGMCAMCVSCDELALAVESSWRVAVERVGRNRK